MRHLFIAAPTASSTSDDLSYLPSHSPLPPDPAPPPSLDDAIDYILLAYAQKLREEERLRARDRDLHAAEERWLRLRGREFGYGDDGKTVVFRFFRPDGRRWVFVEEVADYTVDEAEVEWKAREMTGGTVLLSDIT